MNQNAVVLLVDFHYASRIPVGHRKNKEQSKSASVTSTAEIAVNIAGYKGLDPSEQNSVHTLHTKSYPYYCGKNNEDLDARVSEGKVQPTAAGLHHERSRKRRVQSFRSHL